MSYTVFGAAKYKTKSGSEGQRLIPGIKGDKGDTGPIGSKGDTGQTGSKGDKGDTGPTGSKGDKGDTGYIGPKGDTGAIGPKGDTGAIGPKGKEGSTISHVEIIQDEQTFSFKFVKSDDTIMVTGNLALTFADNTIPKDIVYITEMDVIPGIDQFSIKYHKSDGTFKTLEPVLFPDANVIPRKKNSIMKHIGL